MPGTWFGCRHERLPPPRSPFFAGDVADDWSTPVSPATVKELRMAFGEDPRLDWDYWPRELVLEELAGRIRSAFPDVLVEVAGSGSPPPVRDVVIPLPARSPTQETGRSRERPRSLMLGDRVATHRPSEDLDDWVARRRRAAYADPDVPMSPNERGGA